MAETTGQEKTEAPTQRRRGEARRDGQVARSTDLNAAVILLAAILLLYALGMRVMEALMHTTQVMLSAGHAGNPTRPDDLAGIISFSGQMVAHALLPLLLALLTVALAVAVGQVGFMVTIKPIIPKFSKLDPLKGAKNLVNMRALMRLIMSLGKLTALAVLAAFLIKSDMPALLQIGELQAGQAFVAGAWLVFDLGLKLAILLLFLAILDLAYQRWQHEQDLKMTKQQVKEEMKSMDGDPLMKQRRARVARQLAMQRVAHAVPQADVIVTNPTHFAIALRYEGQSMQAPKVIAKGADFLAMRIRQIAGLHDIPIVERKPLARALYYGVDIGQEIPPEHYAAVAEILAYVYRVSKKSA